MKTREIQKFLFIVSAIKRAYNCSARLLKLPMCREYLLILKKLTAEGFVKSYELVKHPVTQRELVLIKLSRTPNSLFKSIVETNRFGFLRRRQFSLSNKYLRQLTRAEHGIAVYILNTDRGIKTGLEAINLNIGGKLLTRIV